MNKLLIITVLSVTIAGCSTPKGPGAKVLPEKYGQPYQGLRAAAPDLKKERLDLFLGVPKVPAEDRVDEQPAFEEVIYCIALNEEDDSLKEAEALLNHKEQDPNKVIYVWGSPLTKKLGYWWDGIDCLAEAIAIWHPKAQDYVYLDLAYNTPVLRWRNIRNALKAAVKNSGKEALKIVK
jgi:hypothetical protein